jgi:hypothetical protein
LDFLTIRDPAYQLSLEDVPAETQTAKTCYVHVEELIDEIDNVFQDAQSLATRDPAPLRERLSAISKSPFTECWSEDPELQAAEPMRSWAWSIKQSRPTRWPSRERKLWRPFA